MTVSPDIQYLVESDAFDAADYALRYPDVKTAGISPEEHYVRYGEMEGRLPHPSFDPVYYRNACPDIPAAGLNAFRHYCEYGCAERRKPNALVSQSEIDRLVLQNGEARSVLDAIVGEKSRPATRTDKELVQSSGMFDVEYYLAQYPAVAAAGVDPIEHYLQYGAREGRSPSSFFDTAYYAKARKSDMVQWKNPLIHFCELGWEQLYPASKRVDTAWLWLWHLSKTGRDENPLQVHIASSATDLNVSADKKESLARSLFESGVSDKGVLVRLGHVFGSLGRHSLAEAAYLKASSSAEDVEPLRLAVASMGAQGKWWQVVAVLRDVCHQTPVADDWSRLGQAYEALKRYEDAARAFASAGSLDGRNADMRYSAAYCFERAGKDREATSYYSEAVALDPRASSASLGIGLFHERNQRWSEALMVYEGGLRSDPDSAVLRVRKGYVLDRLYRWDEAAEAYGLAIALGANSPSWHYRRGLCLERAGNVEQALKGYDAALSLSEGKPPYWRYRKARMLAMSGDFDSACLEFISLHDEFDRKGLIKESIAGASFYEDSHRAALSIQEARLASNLHDSTAWAAIAFQCCALGLWNKAYDAFSEACLRSNDHSGQLYWAAGYCLYRVGRTREACEEFKNVYALTLPYAVDLFPFDSPPVVRGLADYAELLQTKKVVGNWVLFESYSGKSASCNPYALYRALARDPRFLGWRFVWVLNDSERAPSDIDRDGRVVIVRKDSYAYKRFLVTASCVINNSTFPYWYTRMEGQVYLNTWHGTPYKLLGRDMKGRFLEHRNFARNLLLATHVLSPNKHTTEVLLKKHDVEGFLSAEVYETGYPRIDLTMEAPDDELATVRRRLGVENGQKLVLYAPTWRGTHQNIGFDIRRLVADIEALTRIDTKVVFRGHSLLESMLAETNVLADWVVPQDIDTNVLLAAVDVLITDYSSIFFDFLPLRRPIIFYQYDYEDYDSGRGLYFGREELPGRICETIDDVVIAMEEAIIVGVAERERHEAAIARFTPHDDGRVSERVVEAVLLKSGGLANMNPDPEGAAMLAFAGAFPANGITTSFLSLAKILGQKGVRCLLLVEPASVESFPERRERFSNLPSEIQVACRLPGMVLDLEERHLLARLDKTFRLDSDEMWEVLERAYRREFNRTFGQASFDSIVQFEGYSKTHAALFGCAPVACRKSIYLHSDMMGEYVEKYPYLEGLFHMYQNYDRLVSVSETMEDINRQQLAPMLNLDGDIFVHCENVIDAREIDRLAGANLDQDINEWLGDERLVLTMGRLSPEKDQRKLIMAFNAAFGVDGGVKLLLLGDGPLRSDLDRLVESLDLGERVMIAGSRSNPFPALKRCDCFVLSSNHEGQPIVLLEAMALQRPVVATDIAGSRGVLAKHGYGLLVENSVQGLVAGMSSVLNGNQAVPIFDAVLYQQQAGDAFIAKVLS